MGSCWNNAGRNGRDKAGLNFSVLESAAVKPHLWFCDLIWHIACWRESGHHSCDVLSEAVEGTQLKRARQKMKWKEGWSSLWGVNFRFRAENYQQRYTLFLCTCKSTVEGTAAELKGRKRHNKHQLCNSRCKHKTMGWGRGARNKSEIKEPKGRDNIKTLDRVSPASGNT